MFLAELGLDGRLRPVPGVLPAVVAAAAGCVQTMVVAAENKAEAELVPGVRVVAAESLIQVMDWLRGGPFPQVEVRPRPPRPDMPGGARGRVLDMAEVLGQAQARMAAEI